MLTSQEIQDYKNAAFYQLERIGISKAFCVAASAAKKILKFIDLLLYLVPTLLEREPKLISKNNF